MDGASDSPQSVKEISRNAGCKFQSRPRRRFVTPRATPASDPQKGRKLHLSPGREAQVHFKNAQSHRPPAPPPQPFTSWTSRTWRRARRPRDIWAPRTVSSSLKNLLKVSRPRHQEANPNSKATTPERDPAVGLFRSRHPLNPATGREASDVL